MGKAGRDIDRALTDRERILMHIVQGLSFTQTLGPRDRWGSQNYRKDADGKDEHVHFAKWDDPKPGDLVFAESGSISEWKIGFYVEPIAGSFGGAVIREIGTNRLCNYSNEKFTPIRGLSKYQLFEGDRYQFYVRVLTAFARGDEYAYRFGGLDFDGATATIWVREVFGGFGKTSVPFSITMPWTGRTAVKRILAAMRDGGYGTKSFTPDEDRPNA